VSLVTASIPELCTSLERISELCESDPTLLGAHLEGPFLADAHRGAHDPGLLTAPTPAAVDRLIEAGAGCIAQITIAPELAGGLDAVRRFQRAGVVVAVGHTAADYETAAAAFDAGASVLTHAFNAMDDVRHRQPGPLPAAVERGWVTLELIADGVHVADSVMRLLLAAVPARMALITDAMEATGMPDGDYLLGALPVVVADGVARLRAGGAIAGSTLTLDRAFRRAVQRLRVPIAEAAGMLTEIPARTLGLDDRLGRLDPGFAADLLLFDPDLQLVRGWADGTEIPGIGR
jgi:N-acetylglucosamine-6-phosphate deacetylase